MLLTDKKYHVEHFTCSVCPTVFGPQDSYYEHENDVYCHFHYSTRFATKCAGCNSAILKQFVEINRNNRDECWHPECYMINKVRNCSFANSNEFNYSHIWQFWNVKVSSRRPTSPSTSSMDVAEPAWVEEEERETAQSLKSKQVRMEQQVYRIWTYVSLYIGCFRVTEHAAVCCQPLKNRVPRASQICSDSSAMGNILTPLEWRKSSYYTWRCYLPPLMTSRCNSYG